jgi:multiple sugar transport system substrate-binding protein
MRSFRGSWFLMSAGLLLGLVMLLSVACGPQAEPTRLPGEPSATPPPTVPAEETALPEPEILTLTVWTAESFSPTQVISSGQVLAQAVTMFEESQPNVRLDFVLKKPYGKGGILDYLLTTEIVVPSLLPDLVILDIDELAPAAQAGVLQSLAGLLPSDLLADLYPFAPQAATFAGSLYGLQFQADLDHLVYDTGNVASPPRSWPEVLDSPGPYTFPAGGQAGLVNDAFLIQYLAVRGWPASGLPDADFLDLNSLVTVLQFYQDGASRGILPSYILDLDSVQRSWRSYLAGQAVMTQVSARRYLEDRGQLRNSAVASIPGMNTPVPPISRGWAIALVTRDPARQAAAAGFMAHWLQPDFNAAFNRAVGSLPTRQAALDDWGGDDSYGAFMDEQLARARPRPVLANYVQIAAALQDAVEAVLTGAATPEEAAAQVFQQVP